jgi:hypothetical protein
MAEAEDLPAGYVGRVVMYDDETHLQVDAGHTLAIGDLFMAYRGNGRREGDFMGTAIVTGFDDGGPTLTILTGEWEER